MRRSARQSVLVGIAALGLGARASAESLRIDERVVPACAAAALELGPRVEQRLRGAARNELAASVVIDELAAPVALEELRAGRAGYRVSIALSDATGARGTTVIDAPTCDEAVAAAVVVLALAFGQGDAPVTATAEPSVPVRDDAGAPPAEGVRAAISFGAFTEPAPLAPSGASPARAARVAPSDRAPARAGERPTRLTFATGVDGGTLPQPTLTLAGAIVRPFGGVELAAVARYGLPIADERVESGASESRRQDFGGVELRACRGVGDGVRLSACAGTEVGAVRAQHAWQGQDGTDLDAGVVSPRVAGTLAALVAHRGGLIEPGLELGGAAVAFGREAGAPWLVLRVAAGAAIAF